MLRGALPPHGWPALAWSPTQPLMEEPSWDREQGARFESLHATRKKINFNAQRRELLQLKVTNQYKPRYCSADLDREKCLKVR